MIFDKTKVYTALNAGELNVGDKVYVSDNLHGLQCDVEYDSNLAIIQAIYDDAHKHRFKVGFVSGNNGEQTYCLAYLVERAKEKKYRPYESIDELLSDYGKKYRDTTGFDFIDNALCLPVIWIKEKTSPFISVGINGYDKIGNNVLFGTMGWCDLSRLFNVYEYLDGTPCGKEIED